MGTWKSKEEINQLIANILDKEFKHKGEIAEEIGVHPITLNKWMEISDYSWDDFTIIYKKSLYKQLIELGGVEYLQQKFKEGYKLVDISRELNASESLTTQTVKRILKENNLTKEELGYVKD